MKKEMSSFDIAMLLVELKEALKNARIENIYLTAPSTLIFKLHQPNKPPLNLLIEAGKRFHLTSYETTKPTNPPAFCMALRKYLRNGTIKEVSQYEFERIITIYVTTKYGDFQLVAEFFGEGNIILVNSQKRILQALTYRRMRDRNILRNEVFQHAPSSGKNPLKISREGLKEIKSYGALEIVKALTKFLSIGGFYAEEILLRAKIDKNTFCESLTEQEIGIVFSCIQQLFSNIIEKRLSPCIVINEKGEWVDVTPIPLEKYSHLQQKPYATFNEALDEYYAKTTTEEKATKVSKEAGEELAKLQRILEEQQQALNKANKETETNRKIGDTIYAHFSELQLFLQQISKAKESGESWEQIIANLKKEKEMKQVSAIHFHSLDPQTSILSITIEDLAFSLNLRHSIQANASNYYNEAKKAERKRKGAEKAIQATLEKIEKIKAKTMQQAEKIEASSKIRKKAWYEKFRWFISSDSFLVIGGKDATGNEILIKKHMEPSDIVFHADIVGAPFVLIKIEGKTIPERTLKEAAIFAASYSKAWSQMLGAIDVYWVRPEQVSKSPPSGQYLGKGAFIIHGKKNYFRKTPLKLAVGIIDKEGQLTVVGGPVEAISKQTNFYVEIVPGEQKSGELARQIRNLLAKKTSQTMQKSVLDVNLEEIQVFIPSGRGRILQL